MLAPAVSPPHTSGPGDYLETLIKLAGYTQKATCACNAFRRTMNAWGYYGCWKHRKEIVAWLVAQAKREGVDLSSDDAIGLVRRWVRDVIRGKKG